jgi:hypothetical protein
MPELTAKVPLGDREVEMRRPTDGALVVLARVARGLPTSMIENGDELPDEVREKLIRNLGTLGKVVEGMIVNDADKDWLDEAMIDGTVTAEQVFAAIQVAGEKINGTKTPAKKAAAVRRRR